MKKYVLTVGLYILCCGLNMHGKGKKISHAAKMKTFSNIEQIVFCVPVPADEITELTSDERAKHLFEFKKNKKYTLSIQGFFRAEDDNSNDFFYRHYFEGDEEKGKIILNKHYIQAKHCFYSFGYWSNSIYESRFLEIVWLRKDERITYCVSYPLHDQTLWQRRLQILLQHGPDCK